MKKLLSILFCLLCTGPLTSNAIYEYVKPVPPSNQEAFQNQEQLDEIFATHRIKSVIDLGSWSSASAIYFAEKVGPGGIVMAIHNPHDSSANFPHICQLFISTIKHHGYEDRVTPIRMTTVEATSAIRCKISLIYLGACHKMEQTYTDIISWYPYLHTHGTLCGDDWEQPAVRTGVEQAARKLNKSVQGNGNFWYLY